MNGVKGVLGGIEEEEFGKPDPIDERNGVWGSKGEWGADNAPVKTVYGIQVRLRP